MRSEYSTPAEREIAGYQHIAPDQLSSEADRLLAAATAGGSGHKPWVVERDGVECALLVPAQGYLALIVMLDELLDEVDNLKLATVAVERLSTGEVVTTTTLEEATRIFGLRHLNATERQIRELGLDPSGADDLEPAPADREGQPGGRPVDESG
jgi:hypothetical protein